jgi:hypothetical protein
MSNEENELSAAERELEGALSRLTPAAPRFSLSQVEVRALVARERRRARWWQAVAAVLALGAGAALWARPAGRVVQPQVIERVVVREVERPAREPDGLRWTSHDARPSATGGGEFAYLQLRQAVLARGPESLRGPRGVGRADDMPESAGGGRLRPAVAAPRSVLDYLTGGRL